MMQREDRNKLHQISKTKLTRLVNIHRKSRHKCQMSLSLTVGFEAGRLAVAASCLVDSLDKEDITGATLQAVHRVVVLLDVRYDHPAVCRVVQTWQIHRHTHTHKDTHTHKHSMRNQVLPMFSGEAVLERDLLRIFKKAEKQNQKKKTNSPLENLTSCVIFFSNPPVSHHAVGSSGIIRSSSLLYNIYVHIPIHPITTHQVYRGMLPLRRCVFVRVNL